MQGQYASKNLDSSQKFVLGGPNAVRAYDQGVGVGDEGLLGTAELRYSLPAYRWLTHPQVFAFFDGGSVRVNTDRFLPTQNHIELYGAGVGVNVDIAYGFALRGSVAWQRRFRLRRRRIGLGARLGAARQIVLSRALLQQSVSGEESPQILGGAKVMAVDAECARRFDVGWIVVDEYDLFRLQVESLDQNAKDLR